MGYVSSLKHGIRIPISGFGKPGEFILTAPVGFDDITNAVYGVFVCLAASAIHPPGAYDLVFHLTKALDDDRDEYWDGMETKAWVADAGERAMILSIVEAGVVELIREANPELLTMITHEAHLPLKALRKYDVINAAVAGCGYTIEPMEEWHGQLGWKMRRNA